MTAGSKALELSPHPVLPLDEARKRGLDVSVVRTCAVREDGKVAGCSWAPMCARRTFAKEAYGGFGPKSTAEGTGGEGPRYVQGYHMDSASMTEHEFQMPCHAFMGTLYDEWRQQDETGDIVVIYPQGTAITVQRQVPKKDELGNVKLVTVTETQEPFESRSPSVDARTEFRKRIRENQRKLREQGRMDESVRRLSGGEDATQEEGDAPAAAHHSALKGPKKP